MAEQVLLYPKKGGTGGANKAEPFLFPAKIAAKLVKNGMWSSVPDVSDPKVAEHLIQNAQTEVLKEKAAIAQERADLLAMKKQLEELQAELAASRKPRKSAEV